MKFITNDRRECGDPIVLPQRLEIATSLCSSQRMGRNEADVGRSVRPLGVINVDFYLNCPTNKVKFTDKANNQSIKLKSLKKNKGVDSYYELLAEEWRDLVRLL